MAKVHELGSRFYVQRLFWQSENPPLFHRTTTQEIERPYRTGRCVVLRVPASRTAFVFGTWTGRKNELDALLTATGGRITKDNGITAEELEEW